MRSSRTGALPQGLPLRNPKPLISSSRWQRCNYVTGVALRRSICKAEQHIMSSNQSSKRRRKLLIARKNFQNGSLDQRVTNAVESFGLPKCRTYSLSHHLYSQTTLTSLALNSSGPREISGTRIDHFTNHPQFFSNLQMQNVNWTLGL